MASPDPTLIKANPPVGRDGQPPPSETFVEVTHLVGCGKNSTIRKSNIDSIVDSNSVTPYDPVRNKS